MTRVTLAEVQRLRAEVERVWEVAISQRLDNTRVLAYNAHALLGAAEYAMTGDARNPVHQPYARKAVQSARAVLQHAEGVTA